MSAISMVNRARFHLHCGMEGSGGGGIGIAPIVVDWDGDISHNPGRSRYSVSHMMVQ